ncbi:hypothetical protein MNEG_6509 [Monoraphidium neglectum]|uniref:Single-stranded DNA-binding protein n=1 Tax=Monoraphidium neglectum TaxID=145388 RepID=A0A0D2L2F2_9CHLO|nr:hypothetical protein MNEG_6509 [Monoraphidium neglectum]KIZ01454.1 hypothetical protein MNEG_6509 [Monoraphidium neglectum]|eukprot:XP_013900473.1 hypothetical protein MNEG_6509 [Monoraphidium neglectum]
MAVTHSKDKTSWFRVEMYSPLAEEATARVGRGSRVTINGFLKEDTWVDKATNSRRSKIKVIAQSLGIVSLRGPNQQDGAGAGASDSAPSAAAA